MLLNFFFFFLNEGFAFLLGKLLSSKGWKTILLTNSFDTKPSTTTYPNTWFDDHLQEKINQGVLRGSPNQGQ